MHIVLLELFMDLGASVAFVPEPAAPGARDAALRVVRLVEFRWLAQVFYLGTLLVLVVWTVASD